LKGIPTDKSGIVLSDANWHEGVIGIVASRITEDYHRPTILIAESKDICKGSGRSIPNLDIMEILKECKEYLEDFGGHPMACGIKIKKENIKGFAYAFNSKVELKSREKDLEHKLSVDFPLSIHAINEDLIKKIDELAPFGVGNPKPTFATFNVEVVGSPTIVGNNHLRFTVRDGNKHIPTIAFSQGEKQELLQKNPQIDIAYTPVIDKLSKKPTLKIHDVRVSSLQ